jgi:sialate O-acetylesterase
MKKLIYLLFFVLAVSCQKPQQFIDLPSIISNGMVLQQNTKISLWGQSCPGAKLEIKSSWGVRTSTKADSEGKWIAKLKTSAAGGPFEIVFQTADTSIVVNNVLLGEVWICSGQSNMEMPMCGWPPDSIYNSFAEIAAANYSDIRLYSVPRNAAPIPIDDCEAQWIECSPKNIRNFSATAYFFGRKIHQELNVPVGLIHASWGGTPAESWTSKEYLADFPEFKDFVATLDSYEEKYDSLIKWMNLLQSVDQPKDTQSYESINLNDIDYSLPEYDDSKWMTMTLPAFWENSSLPEFDGVVWFRKEFNLPASLVGKDLVLHLGAIDDMDASYVNGIKIGSFMKQGFWKVPRDYSIPAKILKVGKNVIAVQVFDNTGGGGIYDKGGLKIEQKNSSKNEIILDGDWKFLPSAEMIKGKIYIYGKTEHTFADRPNLVKPISGYTSTALYNAMINPLVPYTIQGAIWYQGEANVGRGFQYRSLFPAMIKCWRNAWGQGDFPFYYVQIAPWNYSEETPSASAEVREAQLMALEVPNTGMVVTTDIGNPFTIHPSNKQDIGVRLALWALAKTYGKDSIICSGPLYDKISIEGQKAIIHFKYAESGLIAKGGPLTYFEIAGEDQKYYPAKAEINGETIEVFCDKVKQPAAVRFGWNQIAEPNLFNGAGLPASPFRTDNWKRLSEY